MRAGRRGLPGRGRTHAGRTPVYRPPPPPTTHTHTRRRFDDDLENAEPEAPKFDNFNFVEFSLVDQKAAAQGIPRDECFALMVLEELDEQFAEMKRLKYL